MSVLDPDAGSRSQLGEIDGEQGTYLFRSLVLLPPRDLCCSPTHLNAGPRRTLHAAQFRPAHMHRVAELVAALLSAPALLYPAHDLSTIPVDTVSAFHAPDHHLQSTHGSFHGHVIQ